MTVYRIDNSYSTYTSSEVDLPDDRSWADVKSWGIKWDTIYITWKDGGEFKQELYSDTSDSTDFKYPLSTAIYQLDDNGDDQGRDPVAEAD